MPVIREFAHQFAKKTSVTIASEKRLIERLGGLVWSDKDYSMWAATPIRMTLAAAILVSAAQGAKAQTAEAALAFLQNHMCSPARVEGYDSGQYSNNYHIKTITNKYLGDTETYKFFLDYDMQSHDDNTGRDFNTLSWRKTISGNLSDLSPNVTTNRSNVKIECTEGRCLNWSRTHLNNQWYGSGSISSYEVGVCDSQSAERIARAMAVLIRRAGGKPSQF